MLVRNTQPYNNDQNERPAQILFVVWKENQMSEVIFVVIVFSTGWFLGYKTAKERRTK